MVISLKKLLDCYMYQMLLIYVFKFIRFRLRVSDSSDLEEVRSGIYRFDNAISVKVFHHLHRNRRL